MIAGKRSNGFGLVEVMVALIVISIGVLGVAAVQASALANTHNSQLESLLAIEARSLADAIQANSAYWSTSGVVPATVDIKPASGGAVTIKPSGTSALNTSAVCNGTSICSAADMAAYDLTQWGQEFFAVVPNASDALITCNTSTIPSNCTIQLSWVQKGQVAINAGTQNSAGANAGTTQTYTLINQF